ncbi:hypothetical protein D3C85_976450 [compost metagenome]
MSWGVTVTAGKSSPLMDFASPRLATTSLPPLGFTMASYFFATRSNRFRSDSSAWSMCGSTMLARLLATAASMPCSLAIFCTIAPSFVPFGQLRVFCVCRLVLPPLLLS